MSSEEALAVKEPVLDYSWDEFPAHFRVSKSDTVQRVLSARS